MLSSNAKPLDTKNDLSLSEDSEDDTTYGVKILPLTSNRKEEQKKNAARKITKVTQRNSKETADNISPNRPNRQKISTSDIKSKAFVSKMSQRRKDLDDMNKSIDSNEELKRLVDSQEETSKIPIIVSVKKISGQDGVLQLWNLRTGEIVKTLSAGHKGGVRAIQKTQDF